MATERLRVGVLCHELRPVWVLKFFDRSRYSRALPMELLEREEHLGLLAGKLDEVGRDGGRIVLVAGEAGIGKTSLLQRFARTHSQARALWGACDALFTPRPLAPVYDLARQTQGALHAALSGGRSRDVVFDALLSEVESVPTLVVFEDLHWADDATLDLIKFLGRRIARTRALLVATYRNDEVGPRHPLSFVLGDLPRTHTTRVSLDALSEAAVAHLAKQAGRQPKQLHRITGGNPLFVTEVLAAASDEGVPVTVRDAVLARVAQLPPRAREIAELVAVVPNKTESWLLPRTEEDAAAIEALLTIGMVRAADGSLAFRHELTRRALEDSLSQPRRERLHAAILEVLKQRTDVSNARLAHHADGARIPSDALRYSREAAGHAATVGAHRESASHYRVALRYATDIDRRERALLQEQLAYECYLTDQVDDGIAAREAALDTWRAERMLFKVGDSLRWLSRLHWFAGRRAEAIRYASDAISALMGLEPGSELAMAYSNRSQLAMLGHDAEGSVVWGRRAIELAEDLGDEEALSHALNNLGTGQLLGGDETGWRSLERSLEIALRHKWQEHIARAYTNLSSMSVSGKQYGRAERYLDEGIAYCERHDLDSWRLYMLAWRARLHLERDHWQGASDDADLVLQHSRTSAISRVPALIVVGHLRLRRGDPDVRTPLDEAQRLAARIDELQRSAPLAIAHAEAAWLEGNLDGIVAAVRPVYELALRTADPWMKGELAVWLARANALTEAPAGIAAPCELEIEGDFSGAAQGWRDMGCRYGAAMVLTRSTQESELREALAIFEELGARPALQLLRQRLRESGVKGVPRGARTSTRAHPHGLTKREAQIFALLAEGMRNAAIAKKLFLSTKTVDHHVSSILTKLGVPSRLEAIAMARKGES